MTISRIGAAGAAALGIAAILASATPAMAATSKNSPMISTSRGNAKFYHKGDKVVVCDAKKDGYWPHIAVEVFDSDGQAQVIAGHDMRRGAGKCATYQKNIREGRTVQIALTMLSKSTHTPLQYARGVA